MIPPLAPRHRIETGNPDAVTVILVGCGGTGSFAALHLARLAYEARRGGGPCLQLIFVDPDQVEAKNIGRQNFCEAEIGLPKAVALATRYNLAFGLEIGAVIKRFEEAGLVELWSKQIWRRGQHLLLIVGCVDSPAARREIAGAVQTGSWAGQRDIWWLDAGNDEHSGQVLLGNGPKTVIDPTLGCVGLPWPSLQEPGIVEGGRGTGVRGQGPGAGEGLSCAELMALNAQSLMINQAMAGWIGVYVYRLLLGHDLDLCQTWLDLRGGSVRSVAVTGEAAQPEAALAGPRLRGAVPDLFGGAVGFCPNCGQPIFEGRDTIAEEVGEDDIVFCPACNWRQYMDEWQATVGEGGEAVAEALGLVEVG